MSREEFVHVVTEGQAAAPDYFAYDAARNREDHELLSEHERPAPMSIETARDHARRGAVLLDTRDPGEFASGSLIGSVNVGLEGRFAQYVGSVVHPDEQVVLLVEPGTSSRPRSGSDVSAMTTSWAMSKILRGVPGAPRSRPGRRPSHGRSLRRTAGEPSPTCK